MSTFLNDLRHFDASLKICRAARSVCRARCSIIGLTHLCKRKSKARLQMCIFCEGAVVDANSHLLLSCPVWRERARTLIEVRATRGDEILGSVERILNCPAHSKRMADVASFLQDVDHAATSFWKE